VQFVKGRAVCFISRSVSRLSRTRKTRAPAPFVADDIMETFDHFRAEEAHACSAEMAASARSSILPSHQHWPSSRRPSARRRGSRTGGVTRPRDTGSSTTRKQLSGLARVEGRVGSTSAVGGGNSLAKSELWTIMRDTGACHQRSTNRLRSRMTSSCVPPLSSITLISRESSPADGPDVDPTLPSTRSEA